MMGMSGKFEIHTIISCLFQLIGLMVELYKKAGLVDPSHSLRERLALAVGAVVAADDCDIAYLIQVCSFVAQHHDARLAAELLVGIESRIVVVVT